MSKIQWTDETWNPIVGCSRVPGSPGCGRCYAATAAKSARLQQFDRYQKVAAWNGTVEFVESVLYKPLSWKKSRKIFTCSMSDLFHENIPDSWRHRVFGVMALAKLSGGIAHQHIFQVLTKRPENMKRYFLQCSKAIKEEAIKISWEKKKPLSDFTMPLGKVWLGATVENQQKADERIPILRETPGAIKFLSCEPLLEPIQLDLNGIDWVIVGGESGRDSRECNIDWMEDIVKQCKNAGTKVFVKQLGSNCNWNTKDRKGGNIDEFPANLRVKETP